MNGVPRSTRHDDWMYGLLPEVFRLRDAERGYPLRSLVRAIQAQADHVAADIGRLYDNWFIETCEDDLVPYFAELVGLSLGPRLRSDRSIDPVWRRHQVANAIRDRRRKGSFSVLEQLAADATGWPARAIEPGALALGMPSLTLAGVGLRELVDVRDTETLEQLGTPLSTAASMSDVRRLASHRTPGAGGPRAVAVWVWRLAAERVSRAPAAIAGDEGRYTFDQLGRDVRLAVTPRARTAGKPPSVDLDVPTLITRLAMAHRLEDYYGPGRSICVYRGRDAVPRSEVLIANLRNWRARTPPGFVTIDPELGRVRFPPRYAPDVGVFVTYERLGVGAIGGGDYERSHSRTPRGAEVYRVGAAGSGVHRSVGAAVSAWRRAQKKGTAGTSAIVEIVDDGVYEERFQIELDTGERLEIRAAQGRRPVLVPVGGRSDRPDQFRLCGPETAPAERAGQPDEAQLAAPVVGLDEIWVAGAPVELTGSFERGHAPPLHACACERADAGGRGRQSERSRLGRAGDAMSDLGIALSHRTCARRESGEWF